MPKTSRRRPELADSDWNPITAEVQNRLLIFEIPATFRSNSGDLEYCLVDEEPHKYCKIFKIIEEAEDTFESKFPTILTSKIKSILKNTFEKVMHEEAIY
jgi:hypothetical protein